MKYKVILSRISQVNEIYEVDIDKEFPDEDYDFIEDYLEENVHEIGKFIRYDLIEYDDCQVEEIK